MIDTNKPVIRMARAFAMDAHAGQVRKGGKPTPYFKHCEAVAVAVATELDEPSINGIPTDNLVAAAYLHDVIEDTELTYADIFIRFGALIADLCRDLTNHFTADTCPDLPFMVRARFEAGRYHFASRAVKLIKRCDIEHNLSNLDEITTPDNAEWAQAYRGRCELILNAIEE